MEITLSELPEEQSKTSPPPKKTLGNEFLEAWLKAIARLGQPEGAPEKDLPEPQEVINLKQKSS